MANEKIAVMTDSNAGISQEKAEAAGITVIPMPVLVNGKEYYEGIDLSLKEFFDIQKDGHNGITTSQPSLGSLASAWKETLKEYDSIVYIPMSSGLSSSCQSAKIFAENYDGRVQVVDNHRISVTMEQSVYDAMYLKDTGMSAKEIKDLLEAEGSNSSIYIMVDTLKYLRQGGRITPAAAALGGLLNIHPVLQIQGAALDTYEKCRGVHKAKKVMIEAMKHDLETRFAKETLAGQMVINYAYCGISDEEEELWKKEIQEAFPGYTIKGESLSMSIATHIGPGALAIACSKSLRQAD